MSEKLNEIIIDIDYLVEKVKDYQKITQGEVNKIYKELELILNDMSLTLKSYENVNYSCKLSLNRFLYELNVLFKIFTDFRLKYYTSNLMLNVHNLYQESEVK